MDSLLRPLRTTLHPPKTRSQITPFCTAASGVIETIIKRCSTHPNPFKTVCSLENEPHLNLKGLSFVWKTLLYLYGPVDPLHLGESKLYHPSQFNSHNTEHRMAAQAT